MTFQFLLWALGKRVTWLADNDESFKKGISKRVCIMQFKTANNKAKQYISFKAGSASSKSELHPSPSIIFNFQNSRTALGLILKMAQDPSDKGIFMDAIKQGKLRIRGDMSLLAWFMMISDHFAPEKL